MENKLFKSQRQTVEELITEYINLCNKYDELECIGLKVGLKFFSIDNLLHWVLTPRCSAIYFSSYMPSLSHFFDSV